MCAGIYDSIGDLMLIAVDQKDRALERICSLAIYIIKPIASNRQLTKLHLSIACMNFMHNISQVILVAY